MIAFSGGCCRTCALTPTQRVHGCLTLQISHSTAMKEINMPNLQNIYGTQANSNNYFEVTDNPNLETVHAQQLRKLGNGNCVLKVTTNPKLTVLDLGSTVSYSSTSAQLYIRNNKLLPKHQVRHASSPFAYTTLFCLCGPRKGCHVMRRCFSQW